MGEESSGEKTEEATPKRLEDARKKGQVWKSKDITGVAGFLVGMGALQAGWPWMKAHFNDLFKFGFEQTAHPEHLSWAIHHQLLIMLFDMVMLAMPVAVGAALISALVEFVQVGALFSAEVVTPKLEKLNPVQGFKNMVSKKQLVELLKSTLKVGVSGYVAYTVIRDALGMVVNTVSVGAMGVLAVLKELIHRTSVKAGLVFLLFGIFDVWFQHRTYMKDNMMTKDEVKREYKESEGDPHYKAKRKEMHHEILEGQMMEAVKGADVVVTNPDHLAIALSYDREKDGAPRVVAKGMDSLAEGIKAVAKSVDVAILRNVPLAHALFRVELGEEIPESLYDAVAEVLSFVYGLREGGAKPAPTAVAAR